MRSNPPQASTHMATSMADSSSTITTTTTTSTPSSRASTKTPPPPLLQRPNPTATPTTPTRYTPVAVNTTLANNPHPPPQGTTRRSSSLSTPQPTPFFFPNHAQHHHHNSPLSTPTSPLFRAAFTKMGGGGGAGVGGFSPYLNSPHGSSSVLSLSLSSFPSSPSAAKFFASDDYDGSDGELSIDGVIEEEEGGEQDQDDADSEEEDSSEEEDRDSEESDAMDNSDETESVEEDDPIRLQDGDDVESGDEAEGMASPTLSQPSFGQATSSPSPGMITTRLGLSSKQERVLSNNSELLSFAARSAVASPWQSLSSSLPFLPSSIPGSSSTSKVATAFATDTLDSGLEQEEEEEEEEEDRTQDFASAGTTELGTGCVGSETRIKDISPVQSAFSSPHLAPETPLSTLGDVDTLVIVDSVSKDRRNGLEEISRTPEVEEKKEANDFVDGSVFEQEEKKKKNDYHTPVVIIPNLEQGLVYMNEIILEPPSPEVSENTVSVRPMEEESTPLPKSLVLQVQDIKEVDIGGLPAAEGILAIDESTTDALLPALSLGSTSPVLAPLQETLQGPLSAPFEPLLSTSTRSGIQDSRLGLGEKADLVGAAQSVPGEPLLDSLLASSRKESSRPYSPTMAPLPIILSSTKSPSISSSSSSPSSLHTFTCTQTWMTATTLKNQVSQLTSEMTSLRHQVQQLENLLRVDSTTVTRTQTRGSSSLFLPRWSARRMVLMVLKQGIVKGVILVIVGMVLKRKWSLLVEAAMAFLGRRGYGGRMRIQPVKGWR